MGLCDSKTRVAAAQEDDYAIGTAVGLFVRCGVADVAAKRAPCREDRPDLRSILDPSNLTLIQQTPTHAL